jgi:hypothetical protein
MNGSYIEVFGLPGTGKSTLLAGLRCATKRAAQFCPDMERHTSYPPSRSVIAGAILILGKSLRHSPLEVSRFLSWRGAWWLPLKLAFRQSALRRHGYYRGEIIEDGGILQPFVSFAAEYNKPARAVPVLPLLTAVDRPRVAVYVRANVATTEQRYKRRQAALGHPMDARLCHERFFEAGPICEDVLSACAALGTVVVKVDVEERLNDQALTELAQRIVTAWESANGSE